MPYILGKTFLAKCIALAACNANIKVLFTSAMDMVNQLIAAEADRSLLKKIRQLPPSQLLTLTQPVEAETPVALWAPSVSASTGNPQFLGWTDQQEVFEKPEASILMQGLF